MALLAEDSCRLRCTAERLWDKLWDSCGTAVGQAVEWLREISHGAMRLEKAGLRRRLEEVGLREKGGTVEEARCRHVFASGTRLQRLSSPRWGE